MHKSLRWKRNASTLALHGALDRDTLIALWQQRNDLINKVENIDVSGLILIDSAGLALLIHLQELVRRQCAAPYFIGISDKLQSLINLYNLQNIIFSMEKSD
ncbi:lipid asymmetry maintenance protein MlaB [Pantoea sp. Nvir]|uniref:lipid asymmetry maintenance protein MlaB n=1 Tax=Pantoea sp. Nvir TaxID=2576760 RepID=UPI0027F9C913|nr:lipid asymmetry maintenance protein MlaB [Pantoea sp. Nvir]CAJ0993333.1 Intermembrane phospholipid transport system binding protein MlaB [Pantoea sp. Nvir]